MLRLFGGMIIGSLMTMMLLGGPAAADKVIENAQSVFATQYAQSPQTITIYLLVSLALLLISITCSNTKESKQSALAIKKLRRYYPKNQ